MRLVTVPDFLRELRAGSDATQQKQGESYHRMMERYQTCDVLIFDYLVAEKLDSNVALKLRMERLIDGSHPSVPSWTDNLVLSDVRGH